MMRKKFSFADHAWLRMDDPENLMVITGLMTFDAPLKYEALKNTIERSMLSIRRFRQRVVLSRAPFKRPYWEDDPNFSLERHLERVELPSPADQDALLDLIRVEVLAVLLVTESTGELVFPGQPDKCAEFHAPD